MKKILFVILAALLAGLSAFAMNDTLWSETSSYVQNTSVLSQAVENLNDVGQDISTVIDYTRELTSADLDVFGSGSVLDGTDSAEVLNPGTEYYFDPHVYPYRSFLSEPQQAVYNQIYANAVLVNPSFALVTDIDSDQLAETMAAVLNDHPELFWLDTAYSFNYYMDDGIVSSVTLSYYSAVSDLEQAQYAFETAAQAIINNAYNYGTDVEKELYVHDALAAQTVYDESSDMNQSAYSALVNGRSVCAGYSRAFQYICQRLGITAYYVTGIADGSNHAWNIVCIGGEYYNTDISWDDSISEAYGAAVYTYFNLRDDEISVDHTRSALSEYLPECMYYTYSYANYFGSTLQISDIQISSGNHMEGQYSIGSQDTYEDGGSDDGYQENTDSENRDSYNDNDYDPYREDWYSDDNVPDHDREEYEDQEGPGQDLGDLFDYYFGDFGQGPGGW